MVAAAINKASRRVDYIVNPQLTEMPYEMVYSYVDGLYRVSNMTSRVFMVGFNVRPYIHPHIWHSGSKRR